MFLKYIFTRSCSVAVLSIVFGCLNALAVDTSVHCRIDQITFDGDASLTRMDYVVPPGGKPPHFRLLAGHGNDAAGFISVELKSKGIMVVGTTPLDQEPLWKSVIKLPGQRDSAITNGEFTLTHFDPHGDTYATGTAQFQTGDGHHGECQFRLPMSVVDLGNMSR